MIYLIPMENLKNKLDVLCDSEPFVSSWYVQDLKTGRSISRNGTTCVRSASTRKIAIMMATLHQVHEGKLSLTDILLLDKHYRSNKSGCFQFFSEDVSLTLQDALLMMIIVSDNACTGALMDTIGGIDAVNAYCKKIGMVHTMHRLPMGSTILVPVEKTNVTSACDVGTLLSNILKGSQSSTKALTILGVNKKLCELAIRILKRQRLNQRMPLLLPHGVSVAHKTGTSGNNTFNDAGIVFGKNKHPLFILTSFNSEVPSVLSDGTPGHAAAGKLISTITRTCYDYFSDEQIKMYTIGS